MMKITLSGKILGLVALTILLAGGAVFATSYLLFSSGLDDQGQTETRAMAHIVQRHVEEQKRLAVGAAASLASHPNLIAAVERKDGEAVRKIGKSAMENLGIAFVTVADRDGVVIGRGHSDKSGDSVMDQVNVKNALSGRASTGVEPGTVVKFSLRAGHPVLQGGRVIGSVTAGFDLSTDAFVDDIKKRFGVESTIFQGDTRIATTIIRDGKRAVGTKMDNPRVLEAVLQKSGQYLDRNRILSKNFHTAYWPVTNVDNKTVGMFFIGKDLDLMSRELNRILLFNFLALLAIGALMTSASFFLVRSITRPINRATAGLTESSDQVASASAQVSATAQQLAEGANDQASSLQETSTSLEKMASMTRQNAGSASQADALMNQANTVVKKANDSMEHLTSSMREITAASEETSKIIRTIDEIAFQTNLLALNAAVEAARAGEAGAGFAVVAEEVRNLAMRAAEAAKNTSGLIEGTVKKIREGSDLVGKTSEAFSEVAVNSAKVGELVGEIAAASSEQAQGIDQINKAVAEMDKVTQQTAASAEESASASEEMTAQAQQMKSYVADLAAVIGDRSSRE
ncbi:MAG TPA: methyl-accepting chemotaxis protein [Syntrophales bacterium]|nr:methyl-accepting chemotaxis protein [Syntrophales bacterium]